MSGIKLKRNKIMENATNTQEPEFMQIKREFAVVINRHSLEKRSNTPDFILAEYLMDCLDTYKKIHDANEKWYGKKLEI